MKFKDDAGHFSYLAEVDLAEGKPIQILPLGTKNHPTYGTIDITPEKCRNFVANFNSQVRGIDLALNYAHGGDPSKGQKAAGWLKGLEFRPDSGLWAIPDYTTEAEKEVADKAWRYISAEYADEWTDASGKTHKDVLIGAALTNKPYMKDMAPINFDEIELDAGSWDSMNTEDMSANDMQGHLQASHGTELDTYPISELFRKHENMIHSALGHQHGKGVSMDEDDLPSSEEIALWEEYDYVLTEEDEAFLKTYRDIPQSARDKMSKGSFAGKGTSFPIQQCSDVRAAWIRVNTAGPSNYDKATLYANIKRIAAAKGFTKCLPKSAQAKSKAAAEGGDMEITVLAEMVGMKDETDEEKVKGRIRKLVDFFLANKDKVPPEPKKTFADEYPEEAKRLADQERTIKTQKADAKIATWTAKGLPPVLNDPIRAFMLGDKTIKLSDDTEEPVSLEGIFDKLLETGLVKLATGPKETVSFEDPDAEWDAKIKEYQETHKDEKLSYREVLKRVARENKELAEARIKNAPTATSS